MESYISGFIKYLIIEKNTSPHTITKYRSDLNKLYLNLNEKYGITSPDKITTTHLREFIGFIRDANSLSAATVANKIAVIKSFFKYLAENSIIATNPAGLLRMPRRSKKIPKFLNDIELAKLLSAPDRAIGTRSTKFNIRDKLILNLLAYTGVRKSELLNLNWDDINLGSKYLIVRNSKNKTDRIIPLHENIVNLLDRYLEGRLPLTNNALLVGEAGKRLNINSFVNLFKKYILLSGLDKKGYTIHTLRHTFATRLLNKNVNLVKIKNLLGHRSIESTEIYLHTTSKDLSDSIDKL